MDYKTREPIEKIVEVYPKENLEEFTSILETLASHGYNFFQWSDFNNAFFKEKIQLQYPEFKDMDMDESYEFQMKWERDNPDKTWFFVEAFGEHVDFIRGEGKTFTECATNILNGYLNRISCEEHDWAYTHKNGHKTCKKCKKFAPCTVEEALEHYPKGSVKMDHEKSLYFHDTISFCTECGSKHMHFLKYAYLPEKQYQCASCEAVLPHSVYYEWAEYKPERTERRMIPGTTEEKIKKQFVLFRGKELKEKAFQHYFFPFISGLILHAVYIEKTDASDKESIQSFIEPYVIRFFEHANITISTNDGVKIDPVSVALRHFSIEKEEREAVVKNLSYAIVGKKALLTNKEDGEEHMVNQFTKVVEALTSSKNKKDLD